MEDELQYKNFLTRDSTIISLASSVSSTETKLVT
jgi:hypothetical protein